MNERRKFLLLGVCIASLAGCASTEPVGHRPQPDENNMAQILGCTSDQVAVCIEVNCEPENYRCTNRSEVREMFKAGEFRH